MKGVAWHLDVARRNLATDRLLLANDFVADAGRSAYMAAFHAALAYLNAVTGKEPKTHGGTHSEFARLVRDDPRLERNLAAFPGQAYLMKDAAEYGGGVPSTYEHVGTSLESAERFVAAIESAILPEPP